MDDDYCESYREYFWKKAEIYQKNIRAILHCPYIF